MSSLEICTLGGFQGESEQRHLGACHPKKHLNLCRYADTQDFISAGCLSMMHQFSRIQHRAESQILKQQLNIWLIFIIKHSMLTPAQKSEKRDEYKFFF